MSATRSTQSRVGKAAASVIIKWAYDAASHMGSLELLVQGIVATSAHMAYQDTNIGLALSACVLTSCSLTKSICGTSSDTKCDQLHRQ